MKKFTVKKDCTLAEFTDETCPQASLCLRALLKEREVRVNGKKTEANCLLRAGDEVAYYMTVAQEGKKVETDLFEDENVLVVDKESGVSSEALYEFLKERGELYFLHRLDRNTEGVMIFAKNEEAAGEILACFRERRAEKIYLALVFGTPDPPAKRCEAYLLKDEKHSLVRISDRYGAKIETEYRTLERRKEITLLQVTLRTGKTHQIRAHLAYLGYPVVGDEKYGNHAKNSLAHVKRQKLLSKSLTLFPEGKLSYLAGRRFVSPKNL